jgi:ATPase subunit of ABC transporter with duplicated ATPase domains
VTYIRSEDRREGPTLGSVITTTGLELRAGARILISDASLRVQPGDRIGLVGRNGAGKTTTLTTLAGERLPTPARSR